MAELEQAVPGLADRSADAARAMILLGLPTGTTLWPAAVHRRWLDRGWAAAQDALIPDDDRLRLAIDRTGRAGGPARAAGPPGLDNRLMAALRSGKPGTSPTGS